MWMKIYVFKIYEYLWAWKQVLYILHWTILENQYRHPAYPSVLTILLHVATVVPECLAWHGGMGHRRAPRTDRRATHTAHRGLWAAIIDRLPLRYSIIKKIAILIFYQPRQICLNLFTYRWNFIAYEILCFIEFWNIQLFRNYEKPVFQITTSDLLILSSEPTALGDAPQQICHFIFDLWSLIWLTWQPDAVDCNHGTAQWSGPAAAPAKGNTVTFWSLCLAFGLAAMQQCLLPNTPFNTVHLSIH